MGYPRMLYKYPGHKILGYVVDKKHERYDTLKVFSDEELAKAEADGWKASPPEAKHAFEHAPPTHEELLIKATELGIDTKGADDKKLGEEIEKELAPKPKRLRK